MSEPQRLESDSAEAADRDSQVEALLVEGLDQYFKSRYEDAIHLWTRVLFLDRSHARARAYIDRARTALAERQRRAEEWLQTSRDLLEQGDIGRARDLLGQAVAASGEDAQTAAVRDKIERLERIHHANRRAEVPLPPRPAAEEVPGWSWRRRSRVAVAAALTVALGAVVIAMATASATVKDWMGLPARDTLRPSSLSVPPPVLSSSEVALVRARALFERGRLAEALQALDRVSPESPVRPSADHLKTRIQDLLLASSRGLPGAAAPGRR